MRRATVTLGLLALAVAASAVTAEEAAVGAYSTLGTADQRELEGRVLRVLESEPVRRQLAVSREVYAADPVAHTRAGRSTLDAALASIGTAMTQWAVNDDAGRPKLFWVTTAAHAWLGHEMPNSGYGIENPDNVYRHAPIDGVSRYEIRGRLPRNPPAQQSFTLYAELPGTGEMDREGSLILGALDRVETREDGSFVVTIDRDPAGDRPNHIRSAERTALLIVRDSLTDWQTQSPVPLSIHRVGGPPPGPAHDEQRMAERAAWLIGRAVPFWVRYDNDYLYSRPANAVRAPRRRGGGWGFSTSGHFELAAGEALVVTVDPAGASYLGFQLADPWGVGLEYVHRSGSRSGAQSRPEADGTITYVISARDPGVPNWLDTSGLDRGIFAIRWQGVPGRLDSTGGLVRGAKRVALSELPGLMPAGTPSVAPEERERELADRRRSWERRMRD